MNSKAKFFKEFAEKSGAVTNLLIHNEDFPFEVWVECDFQDIGRILILPFSHRYFESFRQFYDGRDPEWDLSAKSRSLSDQHGTDIDKLNEVEERVVSHQDARFLIMTQGHVIGYLDIEEIDLIKAGQKNYFGEDKHAMVDIAISDRFHGTGLASLAVIFLKFVAATAGVSLYLVTSKKNESAIRFYIKHGFQEADPREIFIPEDKQKGEPWYVLKRNEFEKND